MTEIYQESEALERSIKYHINDSDFENMLKNITKTRLSQSSFKISSSELKLGLSQTITDDLSNTAEHLLPSSKPTKIPFTSTDELSSQNFFGGINPGGLESNPFHLNTYDEEGFPSDFHRHQQSIYRLQGPIFDESKGFSDENLNHLYESVKEDLSPKKMRSFNKFALNFSGFLNKLTTENAKLRNMLKSTETKLKTTQKKLVLVTSGGKSGGGCPKNRLTGSDDTSGWDGSRKISGKKSSSSYKKKNGGFSEDMEVQDTLEDAKMGVDFQLVDVGSSVAEQGVKRRLEFSHQAGESADSNQRSTLRDENMRLKKEVSQMKIRLIQVQQKNAEKIERKVKQRLEEELEFVKAGLAKKVRTRVEQELAAKYKSFVDKTEKEYKEKQRILEEKVSERIELENEAIKKKVAQKIKHKFDKEVDKQERKLRKKLKSEFDERLKAELNNTLKQSFNEWKSLHKQKISELETSLTEKFEEKLKKMQQEEARKAADTCSARLDQMRSVFMVKEREMKEFYEQMLDHRIRENEYTMRSEFDYQKKLLKIEMEDQLEKFKKHLHQKRVINFDETKTLIEKFEASLLEKQIMIQKYQNEQQEIIKKLGHLKKGGYSTHNSEMTAGGGSCSEQASYQSPSFPKSYKQLRDEMGGPGGVMEVVGQSVASSARLQAASSGYSQNSHRKGNGSGSGRCQAPGKLRKDFDVPAIAFNNLGNLGNLNNNNYYYMDTPMVSTIEDNGASSQNTYFGSQTLRLQSTVENNIGTPSGISGSASKTGSSSFRFGARGPPGDELYRRHEYIDIDFPGTSTMEDPTTHTNGETISYDIGSLDRSSAGYTATNASALFRNGPEGLPGPDLDGYMADKGPKNNIKGEDSVAKNSRLVDSRREFFEDCELKNRGCETDRPVTDGLQLVEEDERGQDQGGPQKQLIESFFSLKKKSSSGVLPKVKDIDTESNQEPCQEIGVARLNNSVVPKSVESSFGAESSAVAAKEAAGAVTDRNHKTGNFNSIKDLLVNSREGGMGCFKNFPLERKGRVQKLMVEPNEFFFKRPFNKSKMRNLGGSVSPGPGGINNLSKGLKGAGNGKKNSKKSKKSKNEKSDLGEKTENLKGSVLKDGKKEGSHGHNYSGLPQNKAKYAQRSQNQKKAKNKQRGPKKEIKKSSSSIEDQSSEDSSTPDIRDLCFNNLTGNEKENDNSESNRSMKSSGRHYNQGGAGGSATSPKSPSKSNKNSKTAQNQNDNPEPQNKSKRFTRVLPLEKVNLNLLSSKNSSDSDASALLKVESLNQGEVSANSRKIWEDAEGEVKESKNCWVTIKSQHQNVYKMKKSVKASKATAEVQKAPLVESRVDQIKFCSGSQDGEEIFLKKRSNEFLVGGVERVSEVISMSGPGCVAPLEGKNTEGSGNLSSSFGVGGLENGRGSSSGLGKGSEKGSRPELGASERKNEEEKKKNRLAHSDITQQNVRNDGKEGTNGGGRIADKISEMHPAELRLSLPLQPNARFMARRGDTKAHQKRVINNAIDRHEGRLQNKALDTPPDDRDQVRDKGHQERARATGKKGTLKMKSPKTTTVILKKTISPRRSSTSPTQPGHKNSPKKAINKKIKKITSKKLLTGRASGAVGNSGHNVLGNSGQLHGASARLNGGDLREEGALQESQRGNITTERLRLVPSMEQLATERDQKKVRKLSRRGSGQHGNGINHPKKGPIQPKLSSPPETSRENTSRNALKGAPSDSNSLELREFQLDGAHPAFGESINENSRIKPTQTPSQEQIELLEMKLAMVHEKARNDELMYKNSLRDLEEQYMSLVKENENKLLKYESIESQEVIDTSLVIGHRIVAGDNFSPPTSFNAYGDDENGAKAKVFKLPAVHGVDIDKQDFAGVGRRGIKDSNETNIFRISQSGFSLEKSGLTKNGGSQLVGGSKVMKMSSFGISDEGVGEEGGSSQ